MNLHRIVTFLRASRHDKLLTIEIAFLLWKIRILLKFAPRQTWQHFTSLIAPISAPALNTSVNLTEAHKIAHLLDVLSPIIPGATCLVRAACAHLLLQRHGIPSAVRLGFMYDAAHNLLGHAWVEVADQVIIGGRDDLAVFSVGLTG